MAEPILRTDVLVKRFGGLTATDHVSLAVASGEVHALIGPNGAGKTTLIGQITGDIRPQSGRVLFEGSDITALPMHRRASLGLARSFQITSLFLEMSVLDNVALAVQIHRGHSFRFWRNARKNAGLREPARGLLTLVGLEERAEAIAGDLSHGEHRQLEIAMALAMEPRMLLLDEPIAGMGPEESRRLVTLLRELKTGHTILLVEHDMDAVFALADRITVLVYGRVIATGTPAEIRADSAVRTAYLGDAAIRQ